MSRRHVSVPKLALSPTKIATALDLSYERVIAPAILIGDLGPVFMFGKQRRILIEDVSRFVRSRPQFTQKVST